MSGSKTEAKNESGAASSMSQKDVEFLVACLQNANGGAVSVDSAGVASALGYDNHRSVQNRISTLKKKYNLPFGSTSGAKGAAGSSAGAASTKPPTTPVKSKVTKTKKEPATKKTPVKKTTAKAPPKSKKKITESDEDADAPKAETADEEMEDVGGDEEESQTPLPTIDI